MILMYLPSEGVAETFDWLVNSWKFYVHPPSTSGAAPLVHAPIKATGGKVVDRPPLIIDED